MTIKVRAGSAGTTYTISTSTNAGYSITGLVSSTTGSASYNDGTVTFQCADTNEHELTIKVKANVARATCQISPSSGCTITGFVKPETYADGASVTVAENTRSLVKTGCSFGGWNTKADGTGTKYVPGATFKITENVVLYAIWTPIPNE